MKRSLQPELLDLLAPEDPRAEHSRRDLLKLNRLMQHPRQLTRFISQTKETSGPMRIVELGAGDGRTLLEAATKLGRRNPAQAIQATLVDRRRLLTFEVEAAFTRLNWKVQMAAGDVFDFLERMTEPADVMIANLFLHHFNDEQLKTLLRLISRQTKQFIALEPLRTSRALFFSRLVGLIGCNSVTRHDARVSVEAGFCDRELSQLWPRLGTWTLTEESSGMFTHVFTASR